MLRVRMNANQENKQVLSVVNVSYDYIISQINN